MKFRMKVHKTWDSALSRMVGEAVLIKRMEEDIAINVLNRKGEWSRCHISKLECKETSKNKVKGGDGGEMKEGIDEKGSEAKVDLGSTDDDGGRQDVSQELKTLKYLHDLFDDFVDKKTIAKPNVGKQSQIRKYFTNLTVRDKSEVEALIYETCGG